MSSALQILMHIPEIADYFLNGLFKQEKYKLNYDVSEEFSLVVESIWKGYEKTYRPYYFKYNVKKYIDILNTDSQQDSAEFLAQLLEQMHNELAG